MNTLLYIDPGLGSMIIQGVVGAVAAGSAAFFMFRQKIAKWFRRPSKEDVIDEVKTEQE